MDWIPLVWIVAGLLIVLLELFLSGFIAVFIGIGALVTGIAIALGLPGDARFHSSCSSASRLAACWGYGRGSPAGFRAACIRVAATRPMTTSLAAKPA